MCSVTALLYMPGILGSVYAAHTTLLLGVKDMEWLEKSRFFTLQVNWIHSDDDFKSEIQPEI